MPTEGKFLTVSEFARRSGRSRKRIYELMQSKLAAYCVTVDGKNRIAEEALSLFVTVTPENCQGDTPEPVKVTEPKASEDTPIPENGTVTVTPEKCNGDSSKSVKVTEQNCQGDSTLQSVIEMLREQLTVKDRQIEQQSERLAELTAALQIAQEQNRELTSALTAAQALHAGTMQQIGERTAPQPVTAQTAEEVQSPEPAEPEPLRSAPPEPDAEAAPSGSERKPGLFARLFRKKKD